jgi:putative redox protein
MTAKTDVNVKWTGKKQFLGVDSTKHSVVMSGQDPENGTGVKPSDMLLLALGGCTAFDVVTILQKQRQEFTALELRISGEQDDQGYPRPFRKIHVEYVFTGKGLSEKAIERAIELSHETYCSVGNTIRGVAEITSSYQIINQE